MTKGEEEKHTLILSIERRSLCLIIPEVFVKSEREREREKQRRTARCFFLASRTRLAKKEMILSVLPWERKPWETTSLLLFFPSYRFQRFNRISFSFSFLLKEPNLNNDIDKCVLPSLSSLSEAIEVDANEKNEKRKKDEGCRVSETILMQHSRLNHVDRLRLTNQIDPPTIVCLVARNPWRSDVRGCSSQR